jgi:hypothetical protein
MRMTLKIATVTATLVGLSLMGAGIANAAGEVTFDIGNVAVGYADGYMDNNHQYHQWEHRADAEQYRREHADKYRAWRHGDPRHHDDDR